MYIHLYIRRNLYIYVGTVYTCVYCRGARINFVFRRLLPVGLRERLRPNIEVRAVDVLRYGLRGSLYWFLRLWPGVSPPFPLNDCVMVLASTSFWNYSLYINSEHCHCNNLYRESILRINRVLIRSLIVRMNYNINCKCKICNPISTDLFWWLFIFGIM